MASFYGKGRARAKIFDSRMEEKFNPRTGSAAIFVQSHVERVMAIAQQTAPRRTGDLRRSHTTSGVRKIGALHAESYVYNKAEHALWVHEGTAGKGAGRIKSLSGAAMPIPKRRLGPRHPGGRLAGPVFRKGYVLMDTVSGQKPQPWLREAGKAARKLVALDAALARSRD